MATNPPCGPLELVPVWGGPKKTRSRRPSVSLQSGVAALLFIALLGGCDGCYRQAEVDGVVRLPYPDCGDGELPEGEVLAEGHLRSGPASRDAEVVERFEVRRRGCLVVATVRQEWPRGTSDIEVVFDSDLLPLRAWKRTTSPMFRNPESAQDIRLYELRTDPPTMTIQTQDGELRYAELRGPKPTAVVGPGRGLLSAWIQRAQLDVGETSSESVLDFRSLGLERIDSIALRRETDRAEAGLGEVQTYTVYGRESVFVDEDGSVVGDLSGLRPDSVLDTQAPDPIPMYGTPDPVGTP